MTEKRGNFAFSYRDKCPVCEAKKRTILFSKEYVMLKPFLERHYNLRISDEDFSGAFYEVARCASCDLLYQTYVLNDQFLEYFLLHEGSGQKVSFLEDTSLKRRDGTKKIREGFPGLEKKKKSSLLFFSHHALEAEKISLLLKKHPREISLLEFGSGYGFFLLMAKAYGFKVGGIEVQGERVLFSQNNGLEIYPSLENILQKKFDVIYSDQVFEHLEGPFSALTLLTEHLIPGGIMKISVPPGDRIKTSVETWKERPPKQIHPLEHINCFSHRALIRFAEKAGLEVISPFEMTKIYLQNISLTKNLNYLQEAVKCQITQRSGTEVYFRKPS